MSNTSTFSVISTGQIHDDFGLAEVQQSFAKLFKTTPEKQKEYKHPDKNCNNHTKTIKE